MRIYLASERVRHPCFGVVGGESGTPGKVLKNGEVHPPKGKAVLETGDRLQVETPGGGGWGKAHDRSVGLIEQDLLDGLITPKAAKMHYGYTGPAAMAAE
jgi:N-methylhydantoinase B